MSVTLPAQSDQADEFDVNGAEIISENESDKGIFDAEDKAPYAPVSERKVLIQQYDYAVRTLMDMITEGDLVLDPDYQRNYRWNDEKASRFIESIALNIPVPVLYLAEESDGSFTVIDGQQRLTSLFRFFKPNELSAIFPDRELTPLSLTGLKVRGDMNKKSFIELDRTDRSVLGKRPIRCIVVLNESDSTLKFEVFERLNTGSASLSDQEVRNCIYRGGFNKLLKELAQNRKFQIMISLPDVSVSAMKDVELVLRFFAYRDLLEETDYSDNYAEYLNNYMEENREISNPRAEQLRALFNDTVDRLWDALGPGVAFRRPLNKDKPTEDAFAHVAINGAIYESQMIAVSKVVEAGIELSPEELEARLLQGFMEKLYWSALFQGTATKARALRRTRILTDFVMS